MADTSIEMRVRGHVYRVVLTPADEGGFAIAVPELPGCFSAARTLAEAETNVREAIELWLDANET
jgi:antitoxin HicB